MSSIIERCKLILIQHYGAQFAGLILYGSMVRQTATPESDIDLLVLLHKPFDYFREVRDDCGPFVPHTAGIRPAHLCYASCQVFAP